MGKRKLVIDCDTGTDDAQAILMALSHSDVEVLALTSVFGNASLEETAYNNLRVLQMADRLEIPVFAGCSMSLLGKLGDLSGFHGNDGLGDIVDENPPDKILLKQEHAANALVRIINENSGEVTLVATGPLTNLAVALMLDPRIGKKLKACFIMGGNMYGYGNVSAAQEFNFYSDQESAHTVLENLGCPITLVPLEICTESAFSWDWYEKFISTDTKEGRFVKRIDGRLVSQAKERGEKMYYAIWDQLAMAAALNPGIALEKKKVYATVELHGSFTRGQVVVDWTSSLNKEPNVTLITKVDKKLFEKMLYKAIGVAM